MLVANEVGAANLDVAVVGNFDSSQLVAVVRGSVDCLFGDDLVLDDLLVGVDVLEEQIEGFDPLNEAFFQNGPFVGRNDPGDGVEGKDALSSFVVIIDGERNSLFEKG